MSTVGNAVLFSVTVMQTSTTGFDRPSRVTTTPLLDGGTDADDMAVLQSSAKSIRECRIEFLTDVDDDVDALRAAKDALDTGTYVDETGGSWTVLLAELTTARVGSELWSCSARMLLPPVVAGS